ncbi:hypothetical protein SAMN05216224_101498 [Thioclava dalianensis]|nr:hypothetical protein [Thioclava dalianensis]SFM82792.1 hypothetical protein SAMN05216224_101498 [Thioclava dalianensis]
MIGIWAQSFLIATGYDPHDLRVQSLHNAVRQRELPCPERRRFHLKKR